MEWFSLFLDMISDLVTQVYSYPVFNGLSLGSIIIVTAISGMLISTFVSRGDHA